MPLQENKYFERFSMRTILRQNNEWSIQISLCLVQSTSTTLVFWGILPRQIARSTAALEFAGFFFRSELSLLSSQETDKHLNLMAMKTMWPEAHTLLRTRCYIGTQRCLGKHRQVALAGTTGFTSFYFWPALLFFQFALHFFLLDTSSGAESFYAASTWACFWYENIQQNHPL